MKKVAIETVIDAFAQALIQVADMFVKDDTTGTLAPYVEQWAGRGRFGRPARDGWDEEFRAMAEHGDDRLLDSPMATEWDNSEWQWS